MYRHALFIIILGICLGACAQPQQPDMTANCTGETSKKLAECQHQPTSEAAQPTAAAATPRPTTIPPTPTPSAERPPELEAFLAALKEKGFGEDKIRMRGMNPTANDTKPKFAPDNSQGIFYAVDLTLEIPPEQPGFWVMRVILKEDPGNDDWEERIADRDLQMCQNWPTQPDTAGTPHKVYPDVFYPGSWDFNVWVTQPRNHEKTYTTKGYNGWIAIQLLDSSAQQITVGGSSDPCAIPTPEPR